MISRNNHLAFDELDHLIGTNYHFGQSRTSDANYPQERIL